MSYMEQNRFRYTARKKTQRLLADRVKFLLRLRAVVVQLLIHRSVKSAVNILISVFVHPVNRMTKRTG